MTGTVFVVSGPSGAGKTTLCNRLLDEFGDVIFPSISHTTRSPRGSERNGVHYNFVSEDEFHAMADAGEFIEWAEVYGNFYGTSKRLVDEHISGGDSVIFDIDLQGSMSLMIAYPDSVVTTMILPPDMETLEVRLRGRGTDANDVIRHRLQKAPEEMSVAPAFDYLIPNYDLDETYDKLRSIFIATRQKSRFVWPDHRDLLEL